MHDLTVEQYIKAVIVPGGDAEITLEGLQEYCGEQLSERIVIESLDTVGKLPETAYGKIDKRLLKEPYW